MKTTFFSTIALVALTACTGVAGSNINQHRRHHARASKASSATVSAAEKMNQADAGPASSLFAAESSLPAKEIAAKALKLSKKGPTFAISQGSSTHSTIYEDYANKGNGSAYIWTADMDIDCDGIDYKCSKNPDGQKQTDFGALAAYEVPWIVIPESFAYNSVNKKLLPKNNIAAVICDGKMFYGIFGDSNGDSPEVIGEASWLMGRACFGGGINGDNGHGQADVTYIAFTGESAVLPSTAVTSNYITQFSVLKSMGDKLVSELAANMKLSTGSSSKNSTVNASNPDDDTC